MLKTSSTYWSHHLSINHLETKLCRFKVFCLLFPQMVSFSFLYFTTPKHRKSVIFLPANIMTWPWDGFLCHHHVLVVALKDKAAREQLQKNLVATFFENITIHKRICEANLSILSVCFCEQTSCLWADCYLLATTISPPNWFITHGAYRPIMVSCTKNIQEVRKLTIQVESQCFDAVSVKIK